MCWPINLARTIRHEIHFFLGTSLNFWRLRVGLKEEFRNLERVKCLKSTVTTARISYQDSICRFHPPQLSDANISSSRSSSPGKTMAYFFSFMSRSVRQIVNYNCANYGTFQFSRTKRWILPGCKHILGGLRPFGTPEGAPLYCQY